METTVYDFHYMRLEYQSTDEGLQCYTVDRCSCHKCECSITLTVAWPTPLFYSTIAHAVLFRINIIL